MDAATCFAGIDVSKDTLDCCLLAPGGKAREHPFANDPKGHAALAAWADRHAGGRSALWFARSGPHPLHAVGPAAGRASSAGSG